jgi:Domain of unknown function (DUF4126)
MALLGAYRSQVSLFVDIGEGAGLSGASGVRPFLPVLLAGALARGDHGIDFSGTDYSFLESPAFLLVVLALAVAAYVLGDRRPETGDRDFVRWGTAALGLVLGALLFAGALADHHHRHSGIGLIAGAACAALGFAAVAALFERARRRVTGGAASLISVYADVLALALAGIAIAVPVVAYAALVVFAFLIVRSRGEGAQKYEGLRSLR